MLSKCCQAAIFQAYDEAICSACGELVLAPPVVRISAKPRDIMVWLFPAEPGSPPKGEPVFVRVGKRIRRVDKIRGKPDGWCWIDG
jgi:hypothetical protein